MSIGGKYKQVIDFGESFGHQSRLRRMLAKGTSGAILWRKNRQNGELIQGRNRIATF